MAQRKAAAGRAEHPTVRYVDLELEGETYKVAFDFNAIVAAEQVAKVNLLQAIEWGGMTAAQYRGLLYASLLKRHPDITLADVGELVTMKSMPGITEALVKAWNYSRGEAPVDPLQPAVGAGEAAEMAAAS